VLRPKNPKTFAELKTKHLKENRFAHNANQFLSRQAQIAARYFAVLSLILMPQVATAQEPITTSNWGAVNRHLEEMMERHELDGLSFVAGWGDRVHHELYLGSDDASTVRVAASATKLVTASVLLSMVDKGLIDLDEPAAGTLPHLRKLFPAVTMRQMLSHTSGMGETHGLTHPHDIPFEQSAEIMAIHVPVNKPAAKISYGGTGFATAGLLAVTKTNKPWRTLYEEHIAEPLGLQDSYYTNPNAPDRARDVLNPNLSGGMMISSRDYRRILAALTREENALLQPETAKAMFSLQFPQADRTDMPGPIPRDGGTGLGVWCEGPRSDNSCGSVHSLGAYGAMPWIDFEAETYGFLLLQGANLRALLPDLRKLQELVRAQGVVSISGSGRSLDAESE